jgi:hypothetical protein
MTISCRPDAIRLSGAGLLLLLFPATSGAQQLPPAAEKLAKTYGIGSFGQIEAIRYTFNAQFPSVDLSRSWIWEPKTDRVTYEGKDKSGQPVKVTYKRSQLDSQAANVQDEIEPGFVNDQYWLLLPFHVVWDTGAAVEDAGTRKLPLGDDSAETIVVKYPSEGGSSPGDTWELYVGPDNQVHEMVFRRGGPKKPGTVIVTWADYKKAGPLLFSLDHRGTADGQPLHVFFSNVAVRLAGSSTWIDAQ